MINQQTQSTYRLWLLALFTIAGFIETAFYGQINSFMPLFLPRLGIAKIII